ncbi:MAG: hypothetical protein LBT55_04250 [Clostridiaceae bacterium]|nr:hypothetical protein [Clostridiaceae bacterium]
MKFKNNRLRLILLFLTLVSAAVLFAACNEEPPAAEPVAKYIVLQFTDGSQKTIYGYEEFFHSSATPEAGYDFVGWYFTVSDKIGFTDADDYLLSQEYAYNQNNISLFFNFIADSPAWILLNMFPRFIKVDSVPFTAGEEIYLGLSRHAALYLPTMHDAYADRFYRIDISTYFMPPHSEEIVFDLYINGKSVEYSPEKVYFIEGLPAYFKIIPTTDGKEIYSAPLSIKLTPVGHEEGFDLNLMGLPSGVRDDNGYYNSRYFTFPVDIKTEGFYSFSFAAEGVATQTASVSLDNYSWSSDIHYYGYYYGENRNALSAEGDTGVIAYCIEGIYNVKVNAIGITDAGATHKGHLTIEKYTPDEIKSGDKITFTDNNAVIRMFTPIEGGRLFSRLLDAEGNKESASIRIYDATMRYSALMVTYPDLGAEMYLEAGKTYALILSPPFTGALGEYTFSVYKDTVFGDGGEWYVSGLRIYDYYVVLPRGDLSKSYSERVHIEFRHPNGVIDYYEEVTHTQSPPTFTFENSPLGGTYLIYYNYLTPTQRVIYAKPSGSLQYNYCLTVYVV